MESMVERVNDVDEFFIVNWCIFMNEILKWPNFFFIIGNPNDFVLSPVLNALYAAHKLYNHKLKLMNDFNERTKKNGSKSNKGAIRNRIHNFNKILYFVPPFYSLSLSLRLSRFSLFRSVSSEKNGIPLHSMATNGSKYIWPYNWCPIQSIKWREKMYYLKE